MRKKREEYPFVVSALALRVRSKCFSAYRAIAPKPDRPLLVGDAGDAHPRTGDDKLLVGDAHPRTYLSGDGELPTGKQQQGPNLRSSQVQEQVRSTPP